MSLNCEKIYSSLFDASLFCFNSISADGPNNSISLSFRAAVNLCATYAPYTEETESGLQDLCNRAGILFIPFHVKIQPTTIRETRCQLNGITSSPPSDPIMHLAHGVSIVLTTVFSRAWYKILMYNALSWNKVPCNIPLVTYSMVYHERALHN